MAVTRRTSTLPLPQAELDRLRSTLSPDYGAQVWEGSGARILVVCVPRPEPDLVNDVEAAIESITPGDVQDLTAALLVGTSKVHAVAVQPFQDLMARRVQFDHDQCAELRRRITAPTGHFAYRAPGDPRKVLRLGIRVPHPSVNDLDGEDFARWAATLGKDLEAGRLNGIKALYLVAEQDDARIDPALFFQDLRQRVADERDRKALAAQLAAKQEAAPRVAYAPLRSIGDEPSPVAATPAPASTAASPLAGLVQKHLEEAGFDVMVAPPTKQRIDLAAERAEGDPQRLIVRLPDKLTIEVAQDVLTTCRQVDVDLALIVSLDAEPEARKRLIATKARWVHPDDVPHLRL